jgi:hypothetical protein
MEAPRDGLGVKRVVDAVSSPLCAWEIRVSSSMMVSDWGTAVDEEKWEMGSVL